VWKGPLEKADMNLCGGPGQNRRGGVKGDKTEQGTHEWEQGEENMNLVGLRGRGARTLINE